MSKIFTVLAITIFILSYSIGMFFGYSVGYGDGYLNGSSEQNHSAFLSKDEIIKLSMMSGFTVGMFYQTYSNTFTESYINENIINKTFVYNEDIKPSLIKCVESAKSSNGTMSMYYAEPCYAVATEISERAINE